MNVLVAMSGGVDSSVAAAMLLEQGHEVSGATLRLWGGPSDSGCCSVADVDDARRVAQQLGIDHFVFNMSKEFDAEVVDPYVDAHVQGRTPNPCVECNRHIKFDRFLERALQLGYDAIATGHHVRRIERADGRQLLARAVDAAKDQSYVLHMLTPEVVSRCLFPIGSIPKSEVRARATALGLRTAEKPESMDVCFIARTDGGRRTFLGSRIPLRSATVVDRSGVEVGRTDAIELLTVGQRRGIGTGGGPKRYVLDVDTARGVVTVGDHDDLLVDRTGLEQLVLAVPAEEAAGAVLVQASAHGAPTPAHFDPMAGLVLHDTPRVRVAPGQSVVLYRGDVVLGGGIAR